VKLKRKEKESTVPTSPLLPLPAVKLDMPALEQWLWDAACAIRGATDAPKFKDFILPLIFYKRLSDVFDDELSEQVKVVGDPEIAREIIDADHADALRKGRNPIVRCYIPAKYDWNTIRNHPTDGKLGEFVTDALRAVAKLNPAFQGVLDTIDFNARQAGQRILDDDRLGTLIEVVSRHRLGLKDTSPDVLGHAYEYLLRKFAEGQGSSAGEFYTPMEVGRLMARLIDPIPKAHVYDPTCGSGGLLIKARLIYEENNPAVRTRAPKLYGQELNPTTFALAKMNMFLHDYNDSSILIGDTFTNPRFTDPTGVKRFDYVLANPMWNQDNYDETFYENDRYERFSYGIPPNSSADWAWVQHIAASLNDTGRAAIVLDTGAVSRGSGSRGTGKEKEIRKGFVEADLIEGVVLLPSNLFYNMNGPGVVLLLNRAKPPQHAGKMVLIDASGEFVKGKPKNVLTLDGIDRVVTAFKSFSDSTNFSKVITLEDARRADYNLSPSKFVDVVGGGRHRPLRDIVEALGNAAERATSKSQGIAELLTELRLTEYEAIEREETPEGWTHETIGNAFSVTQKPRERKLTQLASIPFVPMDLVPQGSTFFENYESRSPSDISSGTYFEAGDALIPKITPSFENGKQGIIKSLPDGFGIGTTEVIPLRGDGKRSDTLFLFFYLLRESVRTELAARMEGSTGRQRLSKSTLLAHEFNLPPIEEQKVIADTLIAIEEMRDVRRREAELYDELLRALIEELTTGRLRPNTNGELP
jgi:type I restriction enzyme M protein